MKRGERTKMNIDSNCLKILLGILNIQNGRVRYKMRTSTKTTRTRQKLSKSTFSGLGTLTKGLQQSEKWLFKKSR